MRFQYQVRGYPERPRVHRSVGLVFLARHRASCLLGLAAGRVRSTAECPGNPVTASNLHFHSYHQLWDQMIWDAYRTMLERVG